MKPNRRRRALWGAYAGAVGALILTAAWLWWRDGAWTFGEMPTHGFVRVAAGGGVALAMIALHLALDTEKRGGEPPTGGPPKAR